MYFARRCYCYYPGTRYFSKGKVAFANTPPPNKQSFFSSCNIKCIYIKTGIQTVFEDNKQELHVLDQSREKTAKPWYSTHRKHNRKSFWMYLRFSNFSFDSSFSLSSWDKDHVLSRILIRHACSRYKHHVIGVSSSPGSLIKEIEFVNAFQFSLFCFVFVFGKWKNEFKKFHFKFSGKLHFTRNLDFSENWKINSLNFQFFYEKIKNMFMLSVRISSYGCTRQV